MNDIEPNHLIVILIYGSLVVLSFLKLTNPLKVNLKANLWFGIFLFLWSTFWIDEVFVLSNIPEISGYFSVIVFFIQFFTPITFYLSVASYTNPNFAFKKSGIKYLILPVIFLGMLFLRESFAEPEHHFLSLLINGLILCHAVFYVSLSFLTIRKHQKKIRLFSSNTEDIDLNWLEYIIMVILGIVIFYTLYHLFFNPISLNLFINCIFLAAVYFVGYHSLKQKEIYPIEENQRNELISLEEGDIGYTKKKITSDEELLDIKNRLEEIMQNQKPYLESDLNLIKLAQLLSVSTHQLSYVINTGFNKNFFQYINEYRVEKAKKLLSDNANNHLSILGIAFESGFNSKTSFNTTFKKMTGQTPSEFKKLSSNL